ncbi:hypothetical protein Y045_5810 [Burkholderia pseudomallei MSHR2451]|nr:hypothetical protein Y045_5810 [Burkholderia pseudomallei MSHR2451]
MKIGDVLNHQSHITRNSGFGANKMPMHAKKIHVLWSDLCPHGPEFPCFIDHKEVAWLNEPRCHNCAVRSFFFGRKEPVAQKVCSPNMNDRTKSTTYPVAPFREERVNLFLTNTVDVCHDPSSGCHGVEKWSGYHFI